MPLQHPSNTYEPRASQCTQDGPLRGDNGGKGQNLCTNNVLNPQNSAIISGLAQPKLPEFKKEEASIKPAALSIDPYQ